MNASLAELAHHRLERAREALRDADLLCDRQAWSGAGNRLYYAVFYAARACLALRQLDSTRHTGVITLFQRHFVKPSLIDATVAKALPRAFEKRQKGDYADFAVLEQGEIERLRAEVVLFIDACASLVERLTGAE